MPARRHFTYSFAKFADLMDGLLTQLGAKSYALYVMDYGAPVGYRLALKHPERVTALIVQNGNAYEEGLREFWTPIKAYWTDNTAKSREALRAGLTPEAYVLSLVDENLDLWAGLAEPADGGWAEDMERLERFKRDGVAIPLDAAMDEIKAELEARLAGKR